MEAFRWDKYDMEDQVFREESFAKGDQLKVKLRVVQYRKPNGDLRTEHHLDGQNHVKSNLRIREN